MVTMILLAAAAAAQTPAEAPSAGPTLGMVEACLRNAVSEGRVTKADEDGEGRSWKYICDGEAAEAMWDLLASRGVKSWEQEVGSGTWLSRDFPLGGCFRRIRNPDGSAPTSGLSCTIWIPRH